MRHFWSQNTDDLETIGDFICGATANLFSPNDGLCVFINPIGDSTQYRCSLGTLFSGFPTRSHVSRIAYVITHQETEVERGLTDDRGQFWLAKLHPGCKYNIAVDCSTLRMQSLCQESQRSVALLRRSAPTWAKYSVHDAALTASAAGTWYWNLATNRVYLSDSLLQLLAYRREELAPTRDAWARIIWPADLSHIKMSLRSHLRGDTPVFECQHRLVTKSGDPIWVRACGAVIRRIDGEPVELTGTSYKLTDSEFLARHAVDALRDSFVFVKDSNLRFRFVNRALADAFGLSKDKILGKSDAEINPNEDEVRFFCENDRKVLREERERVENGSVATRSYLTIDEEVLTDAKKRKRFLTTIKEPLHMPNGEVYLLGVATDISAKHDLKAQLSQMKAQMSQVLDCVDDVVYFKDPSSVFIHANKAMAALVGAASPRDLIGKTDFDLFPPEYARAWYAEEQAIVRSGKPVINNICRNDTALGKQWRLVSKYPILDDNGKVIQILGIGKDITELMCAKDRLRFESTMFDNVLECLRQCVWIKDTLGRYIKCNSHFARRHGYSSPDRIVGKTDFDHWAPEEAERYRRDDQWVMDNRCPKHYREPQKWPDGRMSELFTSKFPLCDAHHEIVGVLGIYEDITELVRHGRVPDTSVLRSLVGNSVEKLFAALDGRVMVNVTESSSLA